MMERRESHLTHRQPSKKASLAWLLVCTVGAALFAVMIATQGALAHSLANHDPQARWFQKCGLAKTGPTPPVTTPDDIFDPIYPTSSIQKLFYGATEISNDSTKDSMLAGGTTCRFQNGTDGGNRSAYWVPALVLRDGTTAGGKQLNAYYGRGATSVDPHVIEPFPEDPAHPELAFKMVARDTNNSQTGVKWYCSNINGEGNNGDMRERPYNCDPKGLYPYVTANISFPQCGNGDLDTTDPQKYPVNDHISHVVYAGSGGCPSSHPIAYPRLFTTAKYNTSRGRGARLAGGADPATDFRSYFFEAWQPGRLQFYVDNCIVAGINCNSTPPAG